ncbi:MAG: signal peptidase [Microbacterium sp.]|jgi:signal peptidase|nr:signal peptidase [Microbacterium sp.]
MSISARRPLRVIGSILLWMLVPLGVISGLLWVGNTAGLVQPLVVVSGSMSPEIQVGDLLIATPSAASDVAVGDVVTLPSPSTGVLVTHRVAAITEQGDTVVFRLKGDNNRVQDAEDYVVTADEPVWNPALRLHGAGYIVMTLMRPAVAIPLVVGVLALVSLSFVPARKPAKSGRVASTQPATPERNDVHA